MILSFFGKLLFKSLFSLLYSVKLDLWNWNYYRLWATCKWWSYCILIKFVREGLVYLIRSVDPFFKPYETYWICLRYNQWHYILGLESMGIVCHLGYCWRGSDELGHSSISNLFIFNYKFILLYMYINSVLCIR